MLVPKMFVLIIKKNVSGSVSQFSHSIVSNSLRPHESQHAGFPVHHQLPEFAQTRVQQVGDAIQLSHPLLSPSLPAFSLSQHQGLLQCKRLELGIWNFDTAVVIGFIVFVLRTGKSRSLMN